MQKTGRGGATERGGAWLEALVKSSSDSPKQPHVRCFLQYAMYAVALI